MRYTVEWSRASEPDEVLRCTGLTARVAFARLISALRHDKIIVRSIAAERRA